MNKTTQNSGTEDSKGHINIICTGSRIIECVRFLILPVSLMGLLIGGVLFLFTGISAIKITWNSVMIIIGGGSITVEVLVKFLEIISDALKAVVFFIIGIGLYSMFIIPLKMSQVLGITSFDHLEDRVIGMIVIIMGIEFLERFILWQKPLEVLQFAGALGIVIISFAIFLRFRSYIHGKQNVHKKMDSL